MTFDERHPATDIDRQLNANFAKAGSPIQIKDGFAETQRKNHYLRSDASGWQIGSNSIVLGASPWQLFLAKPVSTPAGTESVDGYQTIKYEVDTRQQSPIEKLGAAQGWAVKDYNITGNAWVTTDTRCILQYAIDLEQVGNDGTVRKTHYEGGIKK